MELELFNPIARTAQNTNPIFQRRFKQFPEYGEAQRAVAYQRLERMDQELDGHEFVAANRFTIADITAVVAIDIGGFLANIQIPPKLAHLLARDGLEACERQGVIVWAFCWLANGRRI
jgi:glutathione S-transferase